VAAAIKAARPGEKALDHTFEEIRAAALDLLAGSEQSSFELNNTKTMVGMAEAFQRRETATGQQPSDGRTRPAISAGTFVRRQPAVQHKGVPRRESSLTAKNAVRSATVARDRGKRRTRLRGKRGTPPEGEFSNMGPSLRRIRSTAPTRAVQSPRLLTADNGSVQSGRSRTLIHRADLRSSEEYTMNTRIVVALVALFCCPALCITMAAQSNGDTAQKIKQLQQESRDAQMKNDASWAEQHLADGFVAGNSWGDWQTKADYIKVAEQEHSVEVRQPQRHPGGYLRAQHCSFTLQLHLRCDVQRHTSGAHRPLQRHLGE
jgi:hypothetical protein